MRLKNHDTNDDIASALVVVNADDAFDTVEIDINISDLDSREFEGFMIDMVKVLRKYNIRIIRD